MSKPTNQELITLAISNHNEEVCPHEVSSDMEDVCLAYELALRLEEAEVDLAFEKKMGRAMMGLEQADE